VFSRLRHLLPIAFVAIALAGCRHETTNEGADPRVKPTRDLATHPVSLGMFEVTLKEIGVVESAKIIEIITTVGGTVKMVSPDGKQVKKGDPLTALDVDKTVEEIRTKLNDLRIANSDIEGGSEKILRDLRETTLNAEKSRAGLDLKRTQLIETSQDVETLDALARLALIPRTELEQRESAWNSLKLDTFRRDLQFRRDDETNDVNSVIERRKLEDLSFRGRKSLERLELLQDRLESSEILAPRDGLWTVATYWDWSAQREVQVAPGKEVMEGERLGQIVVGDSFTVRSQVSEAKVSTINVGTEVRLVSSSLPGRRIVGRVKRIGNVAIDREQSPGGTPPGSDVSTMSGLKVFELEIEILTPDLVLKNGSSIDVMFVLSRLENVLRVPTEAIHRREGIPGAWVKQPDGSYVWRAVGLQARSATHVVVAQGLSEGDVVAVESPEATLDAKQRNSLGGS